MQLLRRFPALSASSLVFAQRLIEAASVVVITAMIARTLGLSALGEFSYVLALLQLAVTLIVAGLEPVLIRELVKHPERSEEILGPVFLVMLVLAPLVVVLPCIYIFISHPSNITLQTLVMAASVSALPACLQVFASYLRATGHAIGAAKGAIVGVIIGFTARAMALHHGIELFVVLLLLTLDPLIAGLLNYRSFLKQHGKLRFGPLNPDIIVSLLKRLAPAALAGLTVTMFVRYNHILLAETVGMAELGKYSLGFQAFTLANIAPQAYLTVKYASYVRLYETDRAGFEVATRKLYVYITIFSAFQVLLAYLLASILLPLVFGPASITATSVVIMMVAAAVITSSAAVRSQLIYIMDIPRLHVWNALCGLAVLILMGGVLVPLAGAEGAAVALIIAMAVSGILTSFLYPQTRSTGIDQVLGLFLLRRRGSKLISNRSA